MSVDTRFPDAEAYAAETARHAPGEAVDLRAEHAAVTAAYQNRVMLDFNDHCLRLAVFEGPYRWHRHPDSDELFLVVEGELEIELAGCAPVRLAPGQAFVVAANTVHRTRGIGRTVNLTCERQAARTEFVDGPQDAAGNDLASAPDSG
ncbi:cupin domain-containing protein [Stenotrophomonas sp. HITSZ_GD]|uniref:cupin domain-containing protein n=1 Tax=Stenotrophomonas sp. HITSZ_GD TaxID=3037248 RepID=UPI00240D8633|nr:cupin domain-containing protein [Stenotrophomonas sp. HITSZ_GD]MDG2526210.1 cupin domain-containing protein [Stenotrophomonas sp. HITSZ_GD]